MKLFLALIGSALVLGSCFPQDAIKSNDDSSAKTGRIINGITAKRSRPYQVGIFVWKSWIARYMCGGVLIKPKIGLTAAHCFYEGNDAEIYVGDSRFAHGDKYYITKYNWVIHEQYDKKLRSNDIAMFWLPEPVTLSPSLNIIPLGSASPGDIGEISGWGKTTATGTLLPEKLIVANVEIIPLNECRRTSYVTEKQICASDKTNKGMSCTGDSGGALVVNNRLVGITSFGHRNCSKFKPDVFTKVCAYIDWINRTGALSEKPC